MIQLSWPWVSPFCDRTKSVSCVRFLQEDYDEKILTSSAFLGLVWRNAYNSNGVLAHVLEPDEFQGARSKTMNALFLVLSNDHIEERGAGLENENSVRITFTLTLAENYS